MKLTQVRIDELKGCPVIDFKLNSPRFTMLHAPNFKSTIAHGICLVLGKTSNIFERSTDFYMSGYDQLYRGDTDISLTWSLDKQESENTRLAMLEYLKRVDESRTLNGYTTVMEQGSVEFINDNIKVFPSDMYATMRVRSTLLQTHYNYGNDLFTYIDGLPGIFWLDDTRFRIWKKALNGIRGIRASIEENDFDSESIRQLEEYYISRYTNFRKVSKDGGHFVGSNGIQKFACYSASNTEREPINLFWHCISKRVNGSIFVMDDCDMVLSAYEWTKYFDSLSELFPLSHFIFICRKPFSIPKKFKTPVPTEFLTLDFEGKHTSEIIGE